MALDPKKFEKYLEINNNTIYTKRPAKVFIDLTEYKNISEEFGDFDENSSVAEVKSGIYEIPGFFIVQFPEDNDEIKFYLPYNVFLISTNDSEFVPNKKIEINYEEDSPIFYAKFEKSETDIRILDKLFENGVKYLSSDMGILINTIWRQIKSTANIPYHHLEILMSVLFAVYEDNEFKLVRLSKEQRYCKECALNTKKAAHLFGNTKGFLYGYSDDALLTSVVNSKITKSKSKQVESFLDKMISNNLE